MNADQFRESLQRHQTDFVRGSMSFLGWNRFKAEIEDGQKVIWYHGLKIVRIPQIEGCIYLKKDMLDREDLRAVMYVWELNNPDDPEDSENQAAIIGLSIPSVQPGWMIARPEYEEFFDEDGNLIGQESAEETAASGETEPGATAETMQTTAAEAGMEPEMPEETKRIAAHPENEGPAAPEELKENGLAAKEKRKNGETEKKTGAKKTVKADAKEVYGMEEIETRLLEKEKILDRKIQQVEAERQKLLQKEAEIDDQMKRLEEIRKELESIKQERLLRVTDRQKQRMELLQNIRRSHEHTVDELAKRKPYGLMSLHQIRTINAVLDEIRRGVANTDAEDLLHLAEEPRMDDLENFPGTTYSEMALILSPYQYVKTLYNRDRLYMKDPVDKGEVD